MCRSFAVEWRRMDMPETRCYTLKSEADGLELSLCEVLPDGEPRALVQLAHGMSEHKERYLPFMQALAAHGYAAIINDHRGHGASVRDRGDLGYFYAGGAEALLEDMRQISRAFKARFPGKKLILFGHSMGSLAVRAYRRKYESEIDALVVCGSPGANPATGAGLALNRLMTLLRGERYVSPMFVQMTTGGYAKRFPDPTTANRWLSVNEQNVRAYDADPLCGFPFTLNGYRALLELMRDAYAPAPARNPGLPVHFISGADDPCAPDAKGFDDAVARLRADGFQRVTSKMYPGMRHEILNDDGREQVIGDLLALFDQWVG